MPPAPNAYVTAWTIERVQASLCDQRANVEGLLPTWLHAWDRAALGVCHRHHPANSFADFLKIEVGAVHFIWIPLKQLVANADDVRARRSEKNRGPSLSR